jgi:hypothetical protein
MDDPCPAAAALAQPFPGVFRWAAFSPAHRVELTSHAVVLGGRLFVFDPIPLAAPAVAALLAAAPAAAIVLTNENHARTAEAWRRRTGAPVWAAPDAGLELPGVNRLPLAAGFWEGWHLHDLAGGAGGEVALRGAALDLVVAGDALVNLPGRGLEVLPAKYCRDPAALRARLRALAAAPFGRLVMAHGGPVAPDAAARVAALLG